MSKITVLIILLTSCFSYIMICGLSAADQNIITSSQNLRYFVVLKEQADLSYAKTLKTKQMKGRFVYSQLTQTAERTQKDILQFLKNKNINHRPFWIQNMIWVESDKEVLNVLKSRHEVNSIVFDREINVLDSAEWKYADDSPDSRTLEWNINQIDAEEVWSQYGATGEGIVVMSADTGVDWDHPALIHQYRGYNGGAVDHNYNWFDATGTFTTAPGDDHGHGTHTTGTMVGDDGSTNQIGVAPGAQWIAVKNMNYQGSGSDSTFHAGFQWALAPTDLNGNNPNPDMAPHIINNSWGYSGGNDTEFQSDIDVLQAAGILVEASAGNEGPTCASLRSPGDYETVLTTGATISGGSIWSSSSRGPSDLFPGIRKPDIVAPGANIRSSVPGGSYQSGWSGTSMAGPHTSGMIALLWSVDASLIGDIATTQNVVMQTANPTNTNECTSKDLRVIPNNVYGWGEIDCLAAVDSRVVSQAKLFIDDTTYNCSDTVVITVIDSDLANQGSVIVTIQSITESIPESISIPEIYKGVFSGTIETSGGTPAADGILQVIHGDTIQCNYTDTNYGGAGTQTLTDIASVDCMAPAINDLDLVYLDDVTAQFSWTTSESANCRFWFGTAAPPAIYTLDTGFSTTHSLLLSGLNSNTHYYYGVEAWDMAGNTDLEINGGVYYSFTTPQELWNQMNPAGSFFACQNFETMYNNYDIYAADDFQASNTWYLSNIELDGSWSTDPDLHNAHDLNWFVYADNSGEPSGIPFDGTHVWNLSVQPSDTRILLDASGDWVYLSLNSFVTLPANTYWMSFVPSIDYVTYGQWGIRSTANTVWGQYAKQNNPGGGFGFPAGWNDVSADLDFRLLGFIGSRPTEGILAGQLDLERPGADPPDASWSVPVEITLCSGGSEVGTYSTISNENGTFSVSASSGTYDILVKNDHSLRVQSDALMIPAGGTASIRTFPTLPEGDANDDNAVTSTDFFILRDSYNKSVGQPGYDDRADFNENDIVNATDFFLLRDHYNQSGAECSSKSAPGKRIAVSASRLSLIDYQSTDPGKLRFVPVSETADETTFEVILELDESPVSAVDVHLNVNPETMVITHVDIPENIDWTIMQNV
ncbi:S8 family serine peptidase, partial [bacterium]|nr:S8 family serine peptidase [candidate division CSSED10-310 bacterium]